MTPHWLLIFCDPEPLEDDAPRRDRLLNWALHRFLKPGFRHVYALRRAQGFDGWLVVNPHAACLDLLEVTGDDYVARVLRPLAARGVLHAVTVAARRPRRWQMRGIFTCSSVIAHVIGWECGIFTTPWGLYRILSRTQQEAVPMGGIFSSPKPPAPPDTSVTEKRAKKAEKERDRLKDANDAKLRNRRNRSRGRALLAFDETGLWGVRQGGAQLGIKDTLGE